MANRYVRNVTRGCWIKLNQAEKAIELCAAVWVEQGVSIRDAQLSEAIAARNLQAKRRERVLAYAELPGVVYEPCADATASHLIELGLAMQANCFADTAVYGPEVQ